MSDMTCLLIFLIIMGILCLTGTIGFKQSRPSTKYMLLPLNIQIPRYADYGMLPISIGCVIAAVGILLDNRTLGLIGIVGFPLLSLVFMAFKPRWLEPSWVSWLRDHFDRPTLEFLFTQARNDREWDSKVTNQQELEAWARETAEKYRTREEGLFWHSK